MDVILINFSGEKNIKMWRNIKDNIIPSVRKRKQNQDKVLTLEDAIFMLINYLFYKQLVPPRKPKQVQMIQMNKMIQYKKILIQKNKPTNEADRPPWFTQNASTKGKRNTECSFIDFFNAPNPAQTIQTHLF